MENELKIRAENGCILENDMLKIRGMPTFDADVTVLDESLQRTMIAVNIRNRKFFADAVTGTLYYPETGMCSSPKVYIERIYTGKKVLKKYANV